MKKGFKKLDRCEIKYDGKEFFIQKYGIGKNNRQIKKGKEKYIIKECEECGAEFFANIRKERNTAIFCSNSCAKKNYFNYTELNKLKQRNKNISNGCMGRKAWNSIEGFALYDTYKDTLFSEEVRRALNNENILEVKCTYCGKWFKPTAKEAWYRLKGQESDHRKFYCSNECKHACPIYYKSKHPKGFTGDENSSREVQPELRKLVLERDNYTCQKCGLSSNNSCVELHCHHIDPVKSNPIESADIDNCITLCKECHLEAHQKDGCKTGQLANC